MKRLLHLHWWTAFAVLFFYTTSYGQGWVQYGSSINGIAAGDNAGTAVSLSASGQILAVTSFSAGNLAGQVRLFEKVGANWMQKGNSINGVNNGDASGRSIGLDSTGTVIAIGAPYNDATFGPFSMAGHVRIFQWTGSAWAQKGTTLLADSAGDNFGYAVSISADGNTVAVGAPSNGNKGRVKVFRWNTTAWVQLGNPINGKANYDVFGNSVSLSRDGNTMAIGAPFNSDGAMQAGQAQVYTWNGTTWTQMGSDINGTASSDNLGTCVSLSNDGKTLAVGAPQDMILGGFGSAKVYTWNNAAWVQKGTTITSGIFADQFGATTTLSKDGNTLAIGASSGIAGNENGRAEVYNWNGSNWLLKGDTLKGDSINDQFGSAIDLSYNGSLVAIGAPVHNGTGSASGQVKAFTYSTCAPSTSTVPVSVCGTQYTSPSGKYTWTVNGMNYKDTIPNAGGCDSIITIQLTLKPYPVVNLGNNTSVCADSLLLDAGNTGATFLWNTNAVSQTIYASVSGNYIVTVTQNGCSTSDTILVTIKKPSSNSISPVICGNQYVSPSGKIWTTTGTYSDTIPNAMGCDSMITVNLTINPNPVVNLGNNIAVCTDSLLLDAGNTGAQFLWNTNAVSQTIYAKTTGSYFVTVTQNGCAASDTIMVTIKNPSSSVIAPTLCGNQYTSPSGKTWTTSGIYVDTIPNKIGCDSIITVNLTINPVPLVSLGSDTVGRCGDDIVLDAGNAGASFKWYPDTTLTTQTITIDSSGFYAVQVTKNGCSAFGVINVTIRKPSASIQTITVCGNKYVSPSGKYTWTTSDTFMDTVANKSGCDSVMTFHLTLKPSATVNLGNDIKAPCTDSMVVLDAGDAGAGASYLWNNDSTTQTLTVKSSGNYSVTVSMPNGCKISDTVAVVIANLIMKTSINGIVFSVKDSGAVSYTWLDNINNKQPISGANSQSYTAKGCVGDSMNLAVVVNKNGCIDTSDNIPFVIPFIQIGNKLNLGKSIQSIALSADENTMAVGTLFYGVDVYKKQNNSWESKGSLISRGDYWNESVAVSADGNTIIVGWFIPGTDPTFATIYKWNGTEWVQKGVEFGGAGSSKLSVSISADGNTIAYGDPYGHGYNGYANVYQWSQSTSEWVLKGNTIEGSGGGFGTSVSLSTDGNTLAVSAPELTVGGSNNYYVGQIKVYKWNTITSTWDLKGAELNGVAKSDYWGYTVALSADGNTLVSGGAGGGKDKDSIPYVKAFRYDGTNWVQKGSVFSNISPNKKVKVVVSLSADGTRMLASSYRYNSNFAKKIKWNGRDWAQVGSNIVLPSSISCQTISAGGNQMVLATGSEVTEFDECTDALPPVGIAEVLGGENSSTNNPISLYPNPSTGSFIVKTENGNYIDNIEVYNMMGQIVYSSLFNTKTSEVEINLNQNKSGIYFVRVTGQGQQTTARLLLQP